MLFRSDEKRWSKAKSAVSQSHNKGEEAFTDQDWALANHIYHKMQKADLENSLLEITELSKNTSDNQSLDQLITTLLKARKRLNDEGDSDDEEDELGEGFRVFDPEEEEKDDADKWLEENDPDRKKRNKYEEEDEEPSEEDEDEGYQADEEPSEEDEGFDEEQPKEPKQENEKSYVADSEEEKPVAEKQNVQQKQSPTEEAAAEIAPEEVAQEGRFPQPSKEEINGMREYTRPWEQRARDAIRLRAEAAKNPVLHHEGQIVEARNKSHRAFQDAYNQFIASTKYQEADPISQMEMETEFHNQWHKDNPDDLLDAVRAHGEAHEKGLKAKDIHAAAKDEQIRHVMMGGARPEQAASIEEGMQHAGGSKGEEGTTGAMVQDVASSFANSNQDLLNEISKHSKNYQSSEDFDSTMRRLRNPKMRQQMLSENPSLEFAEKNQPLIRRVLRSNERAKAGQGFDQIMEYNQSGDQKDIESLLGEHPSLKDPAKRANVNQFFNKYYPLIKMNATRVLNKLGIDPKRTDLDLGILHEAGLHGLFQAINDYDHENPKKTKFSTHASNKMRGLMQTAMRSIDQIPTELRNAAKKMGSSAQPKTTVPSTQPKETSGSVPDTSTQPKEISSAPAAPKTPVSDVIKQSNHPAAKDMLDRLNRTNTQRAAHGVTGPKTPKDGDTE